MFKQDQEFALRSLDENTLRGLLSLTVHLNLPLAESTLEITATEKIILFCHTKGKEGKL